MNETTFKIGDKVTGTEGDQTKVFTIIGSGDHHGLELFNPETGKTLRNIPSSWLKHVDK